MSEDDERYNPHSCGVVAKYGDHDWEDVTHGPYTVDRKCTACGVLMSNEEDVCGDTNCKCRGGTN